MTSTIGEAQALPEAQVSPDEPAETPEQAQAFMAHIAAKREAMRKHLAAQETVTISLPEVGPDGDARPIPVTINGYRLVVPRGAAVAVPSQVFDMLKAAGYV